jgi:ribose transport system ATP-binding protein
MPLLSIRNASKHYGGTAALIDAALDLHAGEVHALMGENGAGKSTLIKLLAGVTQPDTMQVTLRGQPVAIHNPQAAMALGLRFIHQELNVIPQLSVAENILISQPYPRRFGALVDWRRLNDTARAALAQLDIAHIDPRERMGALGVGDRMLVKIASAFVGDASVYVLDEPTAALNGDETARLFSVIAALKGRGCAVLYVSHRMGEIFQLCDRVTVMRDGRVVATKAIADTDSADLIHLMTGRELVQTYPPRSKPFPPTPPLARQDEGSQIDRFSSLLLVVRNLRARRLDGIDFALRSGEILGVAGLAGAGCAEVLRALVGAERLMGGEIWLDGARLPPLSPARAWRYGLAFLPEERRAQGLILSRSIRDNVTLPHLTRLSRGGALLDRRTEAAVATQTGADVRLKAAGVEQTTRQLSGGNQQKVLFARAIAHPPRVLLLNEPTRGVDVGAKYDIYTLMRTLSADGVGIMMASSDLGELLGMCDRILILRGGRQAAIVDAAGLTQGELLALCYGTNHDGK